MFPVRILIIISVLVPQQNVQELFVIRCRHNYNILSRLYIAVTQAVCAGYHKSGKKLLFWSPIPHSINMQAYLNSIKHVKSSRYKIFISWDGYNNLQFPRTLKFLLFGTQRSGICSSVNSCFSKQFLNPHITVRCGPYLCTLSPCTCRTC